MRDRYSDAVLISHGACNPSGICHSIIEHIRTMRDQENADTTTICNDPAIQLMVYQLAYSCNIRCDACGPTD